MLRNYLESPLRDNHSDTVISKKYVYASSGVSSLELAMKAVQAPENHKLSDT